MTIREQRKFGERVRELREAKKMTLRALAKALGVSAPFVSDVEHGRRMPSDVAKWASVLGVEERSLSVLDERNLEQRVRDLEERMDAMTQGIRHAEIWRFARIGGGYDASRFGRDTGEVKP